MSPIIGPFRPIVPIVPALASSTGSTVASPTAQTQPSQGGAASGPALGALPAVRLSQTPPPSGRFLFPPQGGVCVRTSEGLIQIGVGTWLNKWVNGLYEAAGGKKIPRDRIPHEIPTHFIHDAEFAGPTVGFIPYEFLAYMGFKVDDTVFTFAVENPAQAERLTQYLDLTYLADRSADLSNEVAREYPEDALAVPDLLAEIERGFTTRDPGTLRKVVSFDEAGTSRVGAVEIRRLGNQRYQVTDQEILLGIVDLKRHPIRPLWRQPRLTPTSRRELAQVRRWALEEGREGLWPMGTADGFDPLGRTSGFKIWKGGRYLIVDPPSHTLAYLKACRIPLDRLEGVVLTHGHSDHFGDAVPQLIQAIPSATLYTTPTIRRMLGRQYELALGERGLDRWRFKPVFPGRPVEINGLEFEFNYTFHTVPALDFEIWRAGELALYFSGDTLASEKAVLPLTEPGPNGEPAVMSVFRALQILRYRLYARLSFLQTHPSIILVDVGVPPLHTPPEEIRELIDEGARLGADTSHIIGYHSSDERAQAAGVPKWKEGHEGWLDLPSP